MNFKKIAIISIVFNVAFLLFGSYFIYTKGGISFVSHKVSSLFASDSKVETPPTKKVQSSLTSGGNEAKREFSVAHKVRTSVFNNDVSVDTGVVFLGDSLTNFNEWGEAFPHIKTYNRGIIGDTTVGVMNQLDRVISLKPVKVFLMIGINDLSAKTPKEQILKNYASILKKIKNDLPDTKVYIESILPIRDGSKFPNINNNDINWMNQELEKLVEENGYTFVNLHPLFIDENGELKENWSVDGLHINGNGYKVWEKEIKNYVNR
ncbi:GDSL-type esterase/lipase family protein [Bacillus wiedmannii]|uniref:GDSL-type esterase/lipase family protein n=1 Tax=Bacillus wiedmannii TaxID=1890302 RepID=UPI000BF1FE5E|nr:GDSL-type esterase/lipase family protein [Bacillus wiedmannii]PEJ99343.1 platelet activating factor [Bacillus wiedmannii]